MRIRVRLSAVLFATVALVAGGASGTASSHREAPLISQDPLADNTDVYAFVSPASPDKVTLIANFIPLELPASGPNFWKFDDNVLYEIMVDNDADGGRHHLPVPLPYETAIPIPSSTTQANPSLRRRRLERAAVLPVSRIDGPRVPAARGCSAKTSRRRR